MTRDRARDPSIDALRLAALLGVFAIHAVVPYMRVAVPELLWPLRDSAQTSAADFIFWWGRCAQSQLLFTVAGIVSARRLATGTPREFLASRLFRLGGPLVAGIVFILPLLAALAAWGWMASGRVSWDEVRAWRFADPELQRNLIGPAHLWFLEDLLAISLLYGGWRALRPNTRSQPAPPLLTLAVASLAGVALLAVRPDVIYAVSNSFVPNLPRIAYAGTFFLAGVCLANAGALFGGRWVPPLLLVAAAVAAAITTSLASQPPGAIGRLAPAVSAAATGWCSVLGALGLASNRLRPLPRAAARLSRLAYGIYVIHLPIVCAAQLLLSPWRPNALQAIVVSSFAGLILSWLLVEAGARSRVTMLNLMARARSVPAERWAIAALALGIAVRLAQYGRNPDVWHDEAALLINVIERGYRQLLAPLTFYEAAPPLFLWAERWMALHISDSQWTMRLLPLGASCAALVMMWPAARLLNPSMAPVAILLVAASSKLVGHSVEAKPYAVDALVAAFAIWIFVLSRQWTSVRRFAVFSLAAPLLVWTSYPGLFVVAGVTCALAIAARESRERHGAALLVLLASLAASVAVLYVVAVRHQRSPDILAQWASVFPFAYDPMTLAIWVVRSTIGVADYCFRPFGGVLIVPIAFGVASLWRRGERALAALFLVPIGLAALAGVAWQYPYTGSRTMVFAVPALSLLAAEGLGDLLSRVSARVALLRVAVAAACVLPPVVLTARDLVLAPTRPETAAAAEAVLSARHPDEQVAVSNWEYRYYLRNIRDALIPVGDHPLPAGTTRFWCIVHGDNAVDRRLRAEATIGSRYAIDDVLDLRGVSVIQVRSR